MSALPGVSSKVVRLGMNKGVAEGLPDCFMSLAYDKLDLVPR
jgi:hypothetical protein